VPNSVGNHKVSVIASTVSGAAVAVGTMASMVLGGRATVGVAVMVAATVGDCSGVLVGAAVQAEVTASRPSTLKISRWNEFEVSRNMRVRMSVLWVKR